MGRGKQKPSSPPLGWLSKRELAAAFDVNERSFDKVYRRFTSPEATRDIDGKLYFHARSVIDAWADARLEAAVTVAAGADPLLATGGDSPALERYRAARADQEEMKRDEMRRTHVPLRLLQDGINRFGNRLQSAGEALLRRFGNEAGDILNDAIDDALILWGRELKRLTGDASTDPPAVIDKPKKIKRRRARGPVSTHTNTESP